MGSKVDFITMKFIKKLQLQAHENKIFTYLYVILKLIPLFIVTHDWHTVDSKGISRYLFEFTLGPTIHRAGRPQLMTILSIVLFALCIITTALLFYYYKKMKKYETYFFKTKTLFKSCVWILHIIPFLFNQHIFTFTVETIFLRNKRDSVNIYSYIIFCSFQGLFVVYSFAVSFFLSLIEIGPFFTSGTLLTTTMGRIDFKWLYFAVMQGVIQLEYFVDFQKMIYSKSVVRGVYVLLFLYFMFNISKNYYTKSFLVNLVLTMCFISCIIEFVGMYNYSDDLKSLTNSTIIILLKLLVELFLAILVMLLIKKIDVSRMLQIFDDEFKIRQIELNAKDQLYARMIKFFINYSNIHYSNKALNDIINILNQFKDYFEKHKKKCKVFGKQQCFCLKYQTEDIKNLFNEFKAKMESSTKMSTFSFKDFCPILFDFFEFYLEKIQSKNQNADNAEVLFLFLLFYLECDENLNRSYYFIDSFSLTHLYKSSFTIKIQIELIKKYLKHKLKKKSALVGEAAALSEAMVVFKGINSLIEIEKNIKNAFSSYFSFLAKVSQSEMSKSSLNESIKKIAKTIELITNSLEHHIQNYNKINNHKCMILQTCAKLSLYYQFFLGGVPRKLKQLFEPLSTFYNLQFYDQSENIVMITFSSPKSIQMNLEYMTDTFLVDLGYHTRTDLKISNMTDIAFPKFSTYYINYMASEVLGSKGAINIPYMMLVDKENYLKMYHFESNVVISDKCVYLFGKYKPINKYNSCYLVLDNTGVIIGISKLFNETFFLNVNMLKKLSLSLFVDILGLNFEEQSLKKSYTYETVKFYNNINLLNAALMFENNQDEYASIYQSAREAMKKVKRSSLFNIIRYIEISLVPFSLPKDKENIMFLCFFNVKNKTTINLLHKVITSTSYEPTSSIKSRFSTANNDKPENKKIELTNYDNFLSQKEESQSKVIMKLNQDNNDVSEKIAIIKEQCFAVLYNIYGLSDKVLDEMRKNYQRNGQFREKNKQGKAKEKDIVLSKINFQMQLFVGGVLVFLSFLFFIVIYRKSLYDTTYLVCDTQMYLITAKKILNSIIFSVMGLQFQRNKIQPEVIDKSFKFTYEYYKDVLDVRIGDYLENYKKFRERFYSKGVSKVKKSKVLSAFLFKNINFKMMNSDYTLMESSSNLFEILNYFHIKLKKLVSDSLNPITFNKTDSYYIEGVTNSVGIKFSDATSDTISVLVIENGLTQINYPLSELINWFEEIINESIKNAKIVLVLMNLLNSALIFLILCYQVFVYYNLAIHLFVKWFLNVSILKYFNLILLSKTKVIREVIDIAITDSLVDLGLTKIKIANSSQETKFITSMTKKIENELNYHIFPFHPEKEVEDFSRTLRKFTNDTSPSHIIYATNGESIKLKRCFEEPKDKKKTLFKPIQKKKKSLESSPILATIKITSSSTFTNSVNTTHQNNLTNDQLILHGSNSNQKPTLNQSSNIEEKKIRNEIQEIPRLVFLIIIILVVTGMSIGNYFVQTQFFDLLKKYSRYKTITLSRANYFHEIILSFLLCIMKNTPITLEYVSSGYLSATKEADFLNDLTTHDLFNETVSKYKGILNSFDAIYTDTSRGAFQKHFIQLERTASTNESCIYTNQFFYQNKDSKELSVFSSLNGYSEEDLILQCNKIGEGYNLKGTRTAFLSLANYAIDKYKDFKAEKNRDESYNYNLLQEGPIQTYQVETNRYLEIIFFDYQIALLLDYKARYKMIDSINIVFFFLMIFVLTFITWIYLLKYTIYYKKLDFSIESVKGIINQTILY